MAIFRRKDSPYWWYRIETEGRIITGSTGTGDKKLADKIYFQKRHQVIEGNHFPGQRGKYTRFAEMCGCYLEKHARVNKRSDDSGLVKKLLGYFGDVPLNSITPQRIEEYKASRKGFVKEATINRELACLKTIFSKAVLWGYAAANPVKLVRLYREELKPVKILTAGERGRLFENSPEFLRPILLAALKTGMRRGEILSLKWQDVDLANHNIHVRRTKAGKLRIIPIHPELHEVLLRLNETRGGDCVFSGPKGDRLSDDGAIRTSFDAAVEKAGLGALTFHDLRHNFASELVMKGADLRTVQEYLGHSTLMMVQRYAHVSEGIRRSTIQLLGRENAPQNTTLTLRCENRVVGKCQKVLEK
ncbi:MAG: site-specific integrase [bacterium]